MMRYRSNNLASARFKVTCRLADPDPKTQLGSALAIAWKYNMEDGPFRSVFFRHKAGLVAKSSVTLIALAVICACACAPAGLAAGGKVSTLSLGAPEYEWGAPVAAYAAKKKSKAEIPAEPEKRNSWSIFHRDERSTVSIYYPQMDNAIIDGELAYWSDVRLRTFVAGVAALGEGNSRYSMEIDYSLSQASRRFVSVLFRISTETGGTRPDLGLATFTYDIESGATLSYADIFSNAPGLLTFMSEYARAELLRRLPRSEEELIIRGTTPAEANFAYFALRKDGLELFFPPYQVAASGLGEQSVVIPLDKLAPYGPDLKIWGRKK